MSNNQSLADQAVETLAAVSKIGERVTNEHPGRHAIRSLRHTAQAIVSNALRQALDLADQAERIEEEWKKVTPEGADS